MTDPLTIDLLSEIALRTRHDGECITWTGTCWASGYGIIRVNGRPRPVHRIAWEIQHGPVPDGLEMDHLCRNRACVRLDHLEVVTPLENWRRGYSPHAINHRKTHCKRGHEFTPENTGTQRKNSANKGRRCLACERLRDAKRRTKRRETAR